MNLREAAQMALDALERTDKISGHGNNRKAITALRAALAENAMQRLSDVQQEMERKPLTDDEIRGIDDSTPFHEGSDWVVRFARAIERVHGIGGEK